MHISIFVIFGVIVIFQLGGIKLRLAELNHRLEEIQSDVKKLRNGLDDELRWHKPGTFAKELRQWIEQAAESIRKEFYWHIPRTFANELRGWIEKRG